MDFVPVALYGMPYKVDEIMAVADRYGIPVIEDAAEGFGSRYDGRAARESSLRVEMELKRRMQEVREKLKIYRSNESK